jgi:NAD(P)-dependent dehydrogenase (short-subunit alcohol dehydrogenase family)
LTRREPPVTLPVVITDLLRLDGRAVLVAGAGGAVGSAIAQALAEAGARLALVDLDPGRLDEAASLAGVAGATVVPAVADSCDPDAFGEVIAHALDRFGSLDGLVCVVGGVEPDEFESMRTGGIRTYDSILDRNLRSAVVPHQLAADAMARSGGGSIVSISAATGFASSPYHAMYGAAKAALIALTRTEAVEWGPLGIRVNTVAPGAVETRPPADPVAFARAARAAIPLGRRVMPREVAAGVLFLLSDLASYVTGHTLVLDGGALAKPAFLDADNVPVFVTSAELRERMRSERATSRDDATA